VLMACIALLELVSPLLAMACLSAAGDVDRDGAPAARPAVTPRIEEGIES
jgi:hypothetical protein